VWAHFGTQLDQRTVIHAWLSRAALLNATSLGYRAIWSTLLLLSLLCCAMCCAMCFELWVRV
jgi:hypothetical protein